MRLTRKSSKCQQRLKTPWETTYWEDNEICKEVHPQGAHEAFQWETKHWEAIMTYWTATGWGGGKIH